MNERIQLLAEQAVKDVDVVHEDNPFNEELAKMYIPNLFIERFAELIVRECLSELQISKRSDPYTGEIYINEYNQAIDDQIAMLKEHFQF